MQYGVQINNNVLWQRDTLFTPEKLAQRIHNGFTQDRLEQNGFGRHFRDTFVICHVILNDEISCAILLCTTIISVILANT